MIRLLVAGLLLVSVNAVADTQVTHTFKDGDVIKAEEFNKNFDDLEAAIDNIPAGPAGAAGPAGVDGVDGADSTVAGPQGDTGATGPAGPAGVVNGVICQTNEIVRYDGNAWNCVPDPFAGVNCNIGDQLRLGNNGWECRAEPITASLIQNSWSNQNGVPLPISTFFDSINNVNTATLCNSFACDILLYGVDDHTSCVVQVTGSAVSGVSVNINTYSNLITLSPLSQWIEGEPVYIAISCTS